MQGIEQKRTHNFQLVFLLHPRTLSVPTLVLAVTV